MNPLTNSQKCFFAAAIGGIFSQICFSTGLLLRLIENGQSDKLQDFTIGENSSNFDRQRSSFTAHEYFKI
jgi:hypothetical protein